MRANRTCGQWPLRGVAAGFLALALTMATGFAVANDTIVLKNGNRIQGTIVREDAGEIEIQVGGIRQTLRRSDIMTIDRGEVGTQSPAEAHARQARSLIDRGDFEGAWRAVLAVDAAEASALSTQGALAREAARGLHDQARAAIARGNAEEAVRLARHFVTTDSVKVLQVAFATTDQGFPARTVTLLGEAQAAHGQALYRARNLEQAEALLREAVENLDRTSNAGIQATAQLGLVLRDQGAALLRAGNLEEAQPVLMEAIGCFSHVRENSTSQSMLQEARTQIEQIRNALNSAQRAAEPTPTPAASDGQNNGPAVDTATAALAANNASLSSDYGVLGRIAGEDIGKRVTDWLRGVLPAGWEPRVVTDWTIYVLAFIICFWLIPGKILALLSRRADPAAVRWRSWVTWIGPLALICYIVNFIIALPKKAIRAKSRHSCPHCGFSLDDYFAYTNLNFSQCPNCGGEINPVHSLDEYIVFLANALATDVEKVQMGVVSMSRFVEKDTMQRLVRAIITLAVRRRASDIHVEPAQRHVDVRFRLDGIMVEMCKLPASLGAAVISAIKVQSNLDIAEKRKPQDGKMSMFVDGVDIDIRVATSPAHIGETATLRLLDVRTIQVETKHLGMSKSTRQVFERAIQEPHGLILVTGPTGSGKTTTLYVALKMIQTGDKNIISIEDPIEFTIPGINQIQINPTAGLTFATGLRSMLRQDPDVIMVGEIRDKETAEIAINAAQTGHLVFSTLHTIDAASSISRLYDLGISPRQFADALSLIVAQRLIRLVCRECKQPHQPKPQLIEEIGLTSDQADEMEFFMGKGCDVCNHTGYHGRTGLYELLVPNGPIRTALEKGTLSTVELRQVAIENGMRTLREEALVLLKQGLTTAEEVLRVTK
jgi:type II secretory ATPase GspE/PulE/Tfp pilus assembly ATPase PilB-like protein